MTSTKDQTYFRRTSENNEYKFIAISCCSHIFNRKSSLRLQLIWSGIILLSCIAMIWNIVGNIQLYLYSSPAIKFEYIQNDRLYFPAITVCPCTFTSNPLFTETRHFGIPMENVSELIKKNKYDILSLWNQTDDYFQFNNTFVYQDGPIDEDTVDRRYNITYTEIMSITGKCHMYSLENPLDGRNSLPSILIIYNHPKTYQSKFIKILIHANEDKLTSHFFAMNVGLDSVLHQMTEVNFLVIQKSRFNLSINPCLDPEEVDKCFKKCLDKFIYKHLSHVYECRLPFMDYPPGIDYCNYTNFPQMYSRFGKIIKEFNKTNCPCPRKCRETRYEIQYQLNIGGFSNETIIKIDSRNSITLETEYWSYNFYSLLSDIGGSLGLFLGVSILSIFGIFEKVLRKIYMFSLSLKNRIHNGNSVQIINY